MKKRLLITSIVMMLVVAVALSTATYAWFTANTSVSASSITLTANTNTSEALGIGWGMSTANGASAGTELVSAVTGTLDPMAPTELTDGSTLSTVNFYTSTVKTVNNVAVFNENGVAKTPITYNSLGENPVSTFFVKNMSTANSVSGVTVKAEINPVFVATTANEAVEAGYTYYDSNKDVLTNQPTETVAEAGFKAKNGVELVRIAIFKYDTTSSNFKLVGVMANTASANTVYGTINANYVAPVGVGAQTLNGQTYNASVMQNYSATAGSTGLELGALDALASHDLVAIAWLDGAALGDSQQGLQATITLTFAKTAA